MYQESLKVNVIICVISLTAIRDCVAQLTFDYLIEGLFSHTTDYKFY